MRLKTAAPASHLLTATGFHFASCAASLLLALGFAVPAAAAPPSPLDQSMWTFPGATASPPGAASAGIAYSDRWLGEEPFNNPAVPGFRTIDVSGQLLRVNRQDLRPGTREFDEQPVFIDFAGAWVGIPLRSLALAAYAFQPVLHVEDNSYSRGVLGGPVPPAQVQSSTSMRELRTGLAVSHAFGNLRAGVGGEWTIRSDSYEVIEDSGAPDAGTRKVTLSGSAPGFTAGVHWGAEGLLHISTRKEKPAPYDPELDDGSEEAAEPSPSPEDSIPAPVLPPTLAGRLTIGVGMRYLPALPVDAEQTLLLGTGDSTATFDVEREAGWEAGASAAYRVLPAFTVTAGVSGRSAQNWEGLDSSAGAGFDWSLGGTFHDPRDAWIARFGFGVEEQDDVPESHAVNLSFGLGWQLGSGALEAGLLHRSIEHDDAPKSYEYRFVLTYASR